MPKFVYSLTARLTALVISIFAVIYLVAFFFATEFINTSRLELAEQFLRQQVQLTQERTMSFFERDQKLIEIGVEKGIYQVWMQDPTSFVGEDIAVSHLEVVCRLVNCYGWFLVSHQSGDGISFNQTVGTYTEDDLDPEDYAWYTPLIESGKQVYIDSSVDFATGVRGVYLDYVIRENDEVLGIVGTYARLEDVMETLLSRDNQKANNLLVDDRRRIRLDSNSDLFANAELPFLNIDGEDWSGLFPESLREEWLEKSSQNPEFQTAIKLEISQQQYLVAISFIDQVQWFAVSLYPLAEPNQMFDTGPVIALSIAFLLLCIVITIVGIRHQVIKPVMNLNKVVDAIHSGNYAVRAGDGGADIIQNLGSKIDLMGSKIAAQMQSLNESNIALRRATTEAEKANESKSVFLSNMSHEIRTPMNGVLGTLQILERSELDEKSKELVSKAIYSASSLLTIINDILDFSKIEAHKLVLEQAPFSFGEVLESVKLDTIESVRRKGIELIINIEPGFHDGWMGDYVRVRQILLNLISNAVKFTETGSVTVDVSRNVKNVIKIVVTDTGIGMSDEAQQRIFERFNQADSSTTRKYGGTGLGMPITVSLIRLMGGDISVNSVVNQGTAVAIALPLEQAENVPKHKTHGNTAPSLDSKTILVAEDNEINQLIIKTMLEETNAKVIIVENGKIAVEAFKRYSFDLVLMDIQMPEMDGIEAFTVIRGINESVPVIALTANVMMEDIQKYTALGFVGHIGKPIDLVRFYEVLEDTLT